MPQEGPDGKGICTPQCIWFRCGKQVLQRRGNIEWCSWLEDKCVGPSCAYTMCGRRKLLPGNRCGLVLKRVTTDIYRPDDFGVHIKLRGKITKRLGDQDIV